MTVVSFSKKGLTKNSRSEESSSFVSAGTQVPPFRRKIYCEFNGKLSTGKSLKPSSNFAWVAIFTWQEPSS